VRRIRRRYAAELDWLAPGLPGSVSVAGLVGRLQDAGRPLAAALRVARALVIERLAVLDLEQHASLADVTSSMTQLAETTLELALAQAFVEADALHGPPLDADGRRIDFWIVGMGKLGARELNVSSDIDLVYVYEDDGQTAGPRPVSAHEYFAAIARRIHTLIGEVGDDGFVFRVDLALRPNGMSGPPVVSLPMLEEYFQAQGREWERFAWLKSRVVTPRASVVEGRAKPLRALVTAFVYRRYLDYGVFESLRQLHQKIRDEARRRAAGRPERANDVKLARGGIREIEFLVQLLMVVRGGQFPEIRTRSTLKGLQRLADRGLVRPAAAAMLGEAYVFLRRIEHRIQFLDDQQTHLLPTDDDDLNWIARGLGFSGATPGCSLLQRLAEVRERVAAEFDALLHDGRQPTLAKPCRGCGGEPAIADHDALLARLSAPLGERVRRLLADPRVLAMREDSQGRLLRLVARAAEAVGDGRCGEDSALRFVDWLTPLIRRESYLALLVERPDVMNRLLRLLGLARWPMRYLMTHPGVVDELADPRLLKERLDPAALLADLADRHAAWQRAGQADDDVLLDTLRRAHHAEVFRTLVRDVEGLLGVEQVADELSTLADTLVGCTLDWAWSRLKQRHREAPRIAVIAYGKLGSKELGYGSDLDVVFVYDDEDEPDADRAQEVYGLFVRKLITWLTLRTAAGELFDIDTALRPNGNSGLLVTSMASFERYQLGRGGNAAWTWEHQAVTRARFCAGAPALAGRFEAVRRAVLATPREPAALAAEVHAMRDRLRAARPVRAGRFDVKHSAGGMIDAEFAVQYLVLAHAAAHPALLENVGNIALLARAEAVGLLPPGIGVAAGNAYRELRRAQHRARLDEQPTQFPVERFPAQRDAILAAWQAVFG
jgi:glutamate-ammonia-ligase adenylyltransferase